MTSSKPIPLREGSLLVRVAMIDQAERVRLATAVLGPRASPDTPLAPVLRSILLLHNSEPMLRKAERENLLAFVRAIAVSDAIRDHKREIGGDSL